MNQSLRYSAHKYVRMEQKSGIVLKKQKWASLIEGPCLSVGAFDRDRTMPSKTPALGRYLILGSIITWFSACAQS